MARPGETVAELEAALSGRLAAPDRVRLARSLDYATSVHAAQRRRSGDPYVSHCIAVAVLLAGWGRSPDAVLAGLLHDVPDVVPDLAGIRAVAGDEVADLVAEFRRLPPSSQPPPLGADPDVVAVKIADRLHNARTWEYVPRHIARWKAAEEVTIYAPVAATLGLLAASAELRERSTAELLGSGYRGAPVRLVSRALSLLPPEEQGRYLVEWSGELASLDSRRERMAFAAGLIYSALAIRAQAVGTS